MARIRTIKPEFWTSVQIAECSSNARLMFIGLWNFCDDYGVHPASEMRLKMEVFPSDSFSKEEIRRMLDELLSNGLIQEYEVNNEKYWCVTGWSKHQNIESPTGKWPLPSGEVGAKVRGRTNHPDYSRSPQDQKELRENSTNVSRTLDDHSVTMNQKEKEKEKEKEKVQKPVRAKSAQPFPEDFELNQTGIDYANERFVDIKSSFDDFKNYHQAKGTKMSDWHAAWRTWCNKAVEYGKTKSPDTKVFFNPTNGYRKIPAMPVLNETPEQRTARLEENLRWAL